MIPKKIHYFWFGNGEMGNLAKKCIESWKKFLPDYEIILWDETNFDVNISNYSKQAYELKQYAFVSDYARFYILEKYGGIYMDVDYEVIKPFDEDILKHKTLLALDEVGDLTAFMGAEAHCNYMREMVHKYNSMHFLLENGVKNDKTMNVWMEEVLKNHGYIKKNINQNLKNDICILKDEYFQAKSLLTGKLNITENTYTIHHHTLLWVSPKTKIIKFVRTKLLIPIIGGNRYKKLVEKIKNEKD